jgi:hypothetical protein
MDVLSDSTSPHALIAHVSGLFGIAMFLRQMGGGASLDHVLLTAASAGLGAYLILAVGYAAARRIVSHAPPPEEHDDAPEPSSQQAAEMESDDAKNAPEPQAA